MVLISDAGALATLCNKLAARPFVAVDTEFVSEHSYWPRLCLVQVAAGDTAAAIDPLARVDLGPLFDLLASPSVVKVFHSGRQDMAIFRRLSGHVPTPTFDTQIAAMACGFGDAVAYSTLAASLTGITIDKSMQVTDWSRRPLTKSQIDYALADVVPLCSVYQAVRQRLEAAGRASWVAEEMVQVAQEAAHDADPWIAWQRIQVRGADRRTLAVLREIAAWRETYAARLDLPRPRVARDETLVDIAFRRPRSPADLERIRGFSTVPGNGAAGSEVLEAVGRALAMPISSCPRPFFRAEPADGLQSQVSLLQALLRIRCDEYGVAQRLVATRADLEALVTDPAGPHAVLRGWRASVFGNDALALLGGKLAVTGHCNGARVVKI